MVTTLRKKEHILGFDLMAILLACWVSFLLEAQNCSTQHKKCLKQTKINPYTNTKVIVTWLAVETV